jgi:hypothetical protein
MVYSIQIFPHISITSFLFNSFSCHEMPAFIFRGVSRVLIAHHPGTIQALLSQPPMDAGMWVQCPTFLLVAGCLSPFLVSPPLLIQHFCGGVTGKITLVAHRLRVGFVPLQAHRADIKMALKRTVARPAHYPAHRQVIVEVEFPGFVRPPEWVVNGEMHHIFLSVTVDGDIAFFLVALLTFAYALSVDFYERFPFSTIPNRG